MDIEWWKKHKLELKNILNKNGTLNSLAGKYKDKSIEEAKNEILEDLKDVANAKEIKKGKI